MLVAILVAVIVSLAVGSLIEIHAQSGQFRATSNAGYGAMASRLVDDSNATGGQLAGLMNEAPQLTNNPLQYGPGANDSQFRARSVLQQGLDRAVSSTADQAARAAALVPPSPAAGVGSILAAVLSDRASATLALRSNVDQLLGMTPLPVAGAPETTAPPAPTVLITPEQAATGMAAAGLLFEHADDQFRSLQARIRSDRLPIHLPGSVWVPAPAVDAPLGPSRLGAAATALDEAAAFRPFHQLIVTAIGLEPAPVASGGAQTRIPGCSAPQSEASAAPLVIPPTPSVSVAVTVTNCGTVVEPVVRLTGTLALADAPGTPPPPPGASGGSAEAQVSLRAGSSAALSLKPLAVASGHRYTFTFAIAIPVGQEADNPAGSSQQLLLQISG